MEHIRDVLLVALVRLEQLAGLDAQGSGDHQQPLGRQAREPALDARHGSLVRLDLGGELGEGESELHPAVADCGPDVLEARR